MARARRQDRVGFLRINIQVLKAILAEACRTLKYLHNAVTRKLPAIVTVRGIELREGGVLADVAPTTLDLLDIEQPEAMTGRTLRGLP